MIPEEKILMHASESAIRKASVYGEKEYKQGFKEGAEWAIKELEPKWISVKHSLPPNKFIHHQVVIYDCLSPKQWVSQLRFDGNDWVGKGLDNTCWVTHWMPLPKLPKEV